ncbi:MAG: acyltransferase [Boseongicola sp. SB0676_bin_33]|nr:acyltransferase [Boseongicola sp. SB0676_bin_33]
MKAKLKRARIGMCMEERTNTKCHFGPADQFEMEDVLYEFETEMVPGEARAPGDGVTVEVPVGEDEAAAAGQDDFIVESA